MISRHVPALVLLSGLILSGCSHSLVAPDMTAEGDHALEVLRTTSQFAGASVGYGGMISDEVKAFRVLLRDPQADEAFKSLLGRAKKPGELYALAGLYYTDRDYMERAAAPYLRDSDKVETIFGCMIDKQRISKLTADIVNGALPALFKGGEPFPF